MYQPTMKRVEFVAPRSVFRARPARPHPNAPQRGCRVVQALQILQILLILAAFQSSPRAWAQKSGGVSDEPLPPASGATGLWAVLSVDATAPKGPDPFHEQVAALIESQLALQSQQVLSTAEAKTALKKLQTRDFVTPTTKDIDRLMSAEYEAMMDSGLGNNQRCIQRGESALKQLEPMVPGYNRDPKSSQRLGNLCLYMVRAHMQQNQTAKADQRAEQCVRLVPDLEPSETEHPPFVRERISAARARVVVERDASISVTTSPTNQTNCSVRVNGRRMSNVPLVKLKLPQGEYAVQVECDPTVAGKIFTVEIKNSGDSALVVPAGLGQFLSVGKRVALAYPDTQVYRQRLALDVQSLRDLLGVEHVLAVTELSNHQWYLQRFDVSSPPVGGAKSTAVRQTALVPIAVQRDAAPMPSQVRQPVGLALARRSQQPATATGAALSAAGPAATAPAARPEDQKAPLAASNTSGTSEPDRTASNRANQDASRDANHDDAYKFEVPQWIGVGLGVAGVGTIIGSWAMYGTWTKKKNELDVLDVSDPNFDSVVDDQNSAKTAALALSGVGSAALTAAVPLLLPARDGIPWWAVASGAAGAAIAVTGVVVWAQNDDCRDDACTRLKATVPLGPMIVMQSVPFLSVPITYAIRSLFHDTQGRMTSLARVSPDGRGLVLGLHHRF
jgi:hypothetical protein